MKLATIHRRVIAVMLATWPTVTVLAWTLGPLIANWPMPIRTLVTTLVSVPIILYLLVPRIAPVLDRIIDLGAELGMDPD